MADISSILQGLIGNTQARVAAINAQADEFAASTAQIKELQTVNIEQARGLIDQTAQNAAAAAEIQFARDQAAEKAAAIAGMDISAQENEFSRSMAAYTQAQQKREQLLQAYNEKASVGFFDNPIGYIFNQLQLPQIAAEHNGYLRVQEAAAENIATRNSLLQQHKSTMVVNTAQAAKDLALQQAATEAEAAQIRLREAEAANASNIAGRRLQEAQHRNQIFGVLDSAFVKQLQVAQFEMNLADRQEARAERQKAKKQEEDTLADLNLQLQRLSQFMGLSTPVTVEILKLRPPAVRDAWITAAQNSRFGSNILESLQFLQQANIPELSRNNPGAAMAVQGFDAALDSYAGQVQRRAAAQGQKIKLEDIAKQADDQYRTDLVTGASNPGTGKSLTDPYWDQGIFNPYRAPHKALLDEAAAGTIPQLQNNVMVNAIQAVSNTLSPGAENLSTEHERTALKSVATMVANGAIGVEEAAQQVSQYYTIAALKNRDLYQYDLMGLPPQTRYMAVIDQIGFWGKPVEADLMNTMSVKKALVELAKTTDKSQADAFRQRWFVPQPAMGPSILKRLQSPAAE